MKKITLILGALAILSLGLITKSCSLDTFPTNQIASAELESLPGIRMNLNGIHRWMYNQTSIQGNTSQAAGGQSHTMLIADHMGEDMVMNLGGWFQNWVNLSLARNNNAVENLILHGYYYVMIGNANQILSVVDDIEVTTVAEQHERNMIEGNALFYRAFGHFMLVQFFATRYVPGGVNDHLGVPMPLEPTHGPIARSTVAEVYAQINADLERAVYLLTDNPEVPTHKSYIRANTAHGLLARVALTQGRWDRAAEHARLARTERTLATATQLLDGFYTVSNPDWIWGSEHTSAQTTFFFPFSAHLSMNFNAGAIRTNPRVINVELFKSMADNDIRRQWWDDRPGDRRFPWPAALVGTDTLEWFGTYINNEFTALNTAGFFLPRFGIRKFRSRGITTPTGSGDMSDLVYMRVSEMYLIEAEAEARAGNTAAAEAALTTLMEVRQPGFTVGRISGESLIDEIMRNRRIELWGEGFRFFDLKRLHLPLQRTPQQGWFAGGPVPAITLYPNSLAPTATEWTFPFPLQEMNANPLLEQNPH